MAQLSYLDENVPGGDVDVDEYVLASRHPEVVGRQHDLAHRIRTRAQDDH
jgi:hypothetical protein